MAGNRPEQLRNFYLWVLGAPSAASVTRNYARAFARIDSVQPAEFGLKRGSGRAATAAVLTTLPKNLHVFAEDPDRHEPVLPGIIFERPAVYEVRISPRRGGAPRIRAPIGRVLGGPTTLLAEGSSPPAAAVLFPRFVEKSCVDDQARPACIGRHAQIDEGVVG